ncbi:Helicase associated domain protein [Kitasatospora sp. RB6PN24]|uniref:DEAD/DEAH box helicase n=1 Tax=Kitasatospora humi TaxID=2893891 RepID=UPI001E41E4F0|nr:DEAD/DEAH box helicase [Kitasatospora humi]MCC9311110.1 Helicase associated domain protein [Kitasatospora humi]
MSPAAANPVALRMIEPGLPAPAKPLRGVLPLHGFQRDAVAAAVREVKDGGRATVVAATGSGKTLIAAACARRLAAKGRVLVLVPTIELLEQTAEAWSTKGGRRGLAVAACSREEALESAEAGGRIDAAVTTQAAALTDLVNGAPDGHPVTVYATYASLERIVQAHRLFGLRAWDVVVVDEAHRTAGSDGKPWAAVHTDDQVPAARRLYFTATPRIVDEARVPHEVADVAEGTVICSMDDENVYGKTVYRWSLGEGIEHGYLADYRVLVPVVTDEDLRELLNLPAVADLRSQRSNEDLLRLALQIAVLRAVADLGLRRVITFHSRIAGARAFAGDLLQAAELLNDQDRPERLWASAVAGTDRLRDRRQAFADFAAHTGEDGEECGILANSRLLSEGIDIAAVDSIVFADPKSSIIDIVQAIGRALRQSYRQGKVSWIIIPVYLPSPTVGDDTTTADPAEVHDAGEAVKAEADAEIEASSFRTIWRVLRALAAHDARVVGRITELRSKRSQGTAHTTATQPAEGEAAEVGEGERPPVAVESPIEWLRINARRHAAQILQTVKLRVLNPRAVEWQRMHAVAAVFHLQHGHLDPTDRDKHAELISWLTRQRHLHGQGLLDPARVSELDALGMIWSKNANAWERGYAYAKAFHQQHGHLAIPATVKLDDYAVGAWMRRQRRADRLTKDQVAKLDALDELWRLEPDWNRSYRRLLAYLAAGGTLTGPANRTGLGADPAFRPGSWLRKQAKARSDGKLTDQQAALLDALQRHAETAVG